MSRNLTLNESSYPGQIAPGDDGLNIITPFKLELIDTDGFTKKYSLHNEYYIKEKEQKYFRKAQFSGDPSKLDSFTFVNDNGLLENCSLGVNCKVESSWESKQYCKKKGKVYQLVNKTPIHKDKKNAQLK